MVYKSSAKIVNFVLKNNFCVKIQTFKTANFAKIQTFKMIFYVKKQTFKSANFAKIQTFRLKSDSY